MTNPHNSIALTALPYSGKTQVAQVFERELGYVQISHSGILREEAVNRGLSLPLRRDDYMNTYFQMIEEKGVYALAEIALGKMLELPGGTNVLFDSARSKYELECYRSRLQSFSVLGLVVSTDIDESTRIRFRWMQESTREDVVKMSWEEFKERDRIEWGEAHPFYSVKKCVEMCNYTIFNNGSETDLEAKTRALIAEKFR